MTTDYSDLLVNPGEGETINGTIIKIRAGLLGGDFSIMQATVEAHQLLAPHTHAREDQAVFVISGELEFEVGGEGGTRFTAGTGAYVAKPRGVSHCFWNIKDEPCHYIELSGRTGFEGFVDSTADGSMKASMKAEEDYGVTFHRERIPVLMLKHGLTSIAGMEMPWEGKAAPFSR